MNYLIEFSDEQRKGLEKLKKEGGAPFKWHIQKALDEYLEKYLALYAAKRGK